MEVLHPELYFARARERFFAKTKWSQSIHPVLGTPCLLWTASKDIWGYGRFLFDGKKRFAHRVAWMLEHGRWPEPNGLHKCDVPECVNHLHVFEGTFAENSADMVRKGRSSVLHRYGESNPSSKLSVLNVLAIRELHGTGMGYHRLSRKFGMSETQIRRIVFRKSWSTI
jgi:hypothetical protein